MSLVSAFLARVPSLEVAARLAYWRVPILRREGNRLRATLASRPRDRATAGPIDFEQILKALRNLGVGEGDILIVHSSYNALKPTGLTPEQIIAGLAALVGGAGTIAMPAIPVIRHEPKDSDKFSDAAYDRTFDYDARSTRIATGALPKALMLWPGAVRSRHPGNSMVAIGAQAEMMMRDNLADDEPMPCGPGSSWHYCYLHNAKIISLGVDMVHTLTMIHVAEDAFDWPVANWYRRRRFTIRDGDFQREITVRERRHSWSQFYAERAFSRDLTGADVATVTAIDGLPVSFCESRKLIDFLRAHPRAGYPYYFPLGLRRG